MFVTWADLAIPVIEFNIYVFNFFFNINGKNVCSDYLPAVPAITFCNVVAGGNAIPFHCCFQQCGLYMNVAVVLEPRLRHKKSHQEKSFSLNTFGAYCKLSHLCVCCHLAARDWGMQRWRSDSPTESSLSSLTLDMEIQGLQWCIHKYKAIHLQRKQTYYNYNSRGQLSSANV